MNKDSFVGIDIGDSFGAIVEENKLSILSDRQLEIIGINAHKSHNAYIVRNDVKLLTTDQNTFLNEVENYFRKFDVSNQKDLEKTKDQVLTAIEDIRGSDKSNLMGKVFNLAGLLNTSVDFGENIKSFSSQLFLLFTGG